MCWLLWWTMGMVMGGNIVFLPGSKIRLISKTVKMARCSIFKNKTKAELLAAMRTKHSQQQRNAVAKAAQKFFKYGTLFALSNKCSVSNAHVGSELEGFDPVTRRWVAGELACI
eukprot:PhM_4_TR478/c2_g2_i2/m.27574